MDYQLTEEHLMIRKAARDFAQNELLPGVIERDEKMKYPTAPGWLFLSLAQAFIGSGRETGH